MTFAYIEGSCRFIYLARPHLFASISFSLLSETKSLLLKVLLYCPVSNGRRLALELSRASRFQLSNQ